MTHAAVEVDHFGQILRPQLRRAKPMAASWAIGRRVSMLALVSSSRPSAIGRFVLVEKRHLLLDAVLEDLEIFLLQVGDVARRAIGDRDVQRHQFDAGSE